MSYPGDRQCSENHEQISASSPVRVDITESATHALDKAVYIDLPGMGSEMTAGQTCGKIESVKSVSNLVASAGGKVVAVNQGVVNDLKLATDDPYGTWLHGIEVAELPELMDSAAYKALAKET